jgi:(E)-4-hydroxy-3-methylbut-2-enyl-diphosphate synthase
VDEDADEADIDMAELMLREALDCCELAEDTGFRNIVLSLKGSDVPTTMRAYRMAAEKTDYPLHVGVTAAGPPRDSILKSSIGIGGLLAEGIGDTIRVSMTGPPEEEVKVGRRILQALGLHEKEGPEIISCPTCGRCHVDLAETVREVERRLEGMRADITVAVMGCVVNGPGEAAEADVGLAGGKNGGFIFRRGRKVRKVTADEELVDALMAEVDQIC